MTMTLAQKRHRLGNTLLKYAPRLWITGKLVTGVDMDNRLYNEAGIVFCKLPIENRKAVNGKKT
jgi:hypothetical protein